MPSTYSGQLESSNLHWFTFGLLHYKINNIKGILDNILTFYIFSFDSKWKDNNDDNKDAICLG